MQQFCKTRKSTIALTRVHHRPMLEPLLLNLAEQSSLLRSDAWLALNLHLERNPTGINRHDVEISQSFFEPLLKYSTDRPAAMNQPANPGPVVFNPAIPFQRLPNTTLICRFHLHDTIYNYYKPINSDFYGLLCSSKPIRL